MNREDTREFVAALSVLPRRRLPTLNVLEAARRIRGLVPETKIIFPTLHTSPQLIAEALKLGAPGYVFKSEAVSDLLPAINAVLSGRR
ncbi:MAG: response regulator [Terracidiphilus sp.]